MYIQSLVAKKRLNSRKEATIELIAKAKKVKVKASAPSGKSRGKEEVEPWSKKGIDFSLAFLNKLGKQIKVSFDSFEDLEKIEQLVRNYDKTPKLELVGGNSLFLLEAVLLKAMAASQELEVWQFLSKQSKPNLPTPLGNCIGGGLHVKQARKTDFQEFLLIPRTKSFEEAFKINRYAYRTAKKLLKKKDKDWKGKLTDENALASTLDNESVLSLLQIVQTKLKNQGFKLELGIDLAASTFFSKGFYRYKNFSKERKMKNLNSKEQLDYVAKLINRFKLSYVEDPFWPEHEEEWAKLLNSTECLIAGDDLTCTKLELVKKAVKAKAINALIVKPNQVGSIVETKKVVDWAKQHGLELIISHRSGETEDSLIADLAVGWRLPYIKAGIIGKEREAKLKRLIEIEKRK